MSRFDKGMDDYYSGKEPDKNATIEYLQGFGYAESLLYPEEQPEQIDDRIQEYPYDSEEENNN
jgi:hypothetical protein